VWCGEGPVIQKVTIGSLPDNVLLDIFDFYQVIISEYEDEFPWNWEKLVHVCQRWRYLIFESPIRLNLQLFCTERTPVRELLDVWPAFPLVIKFNYSYLWSDSEEDSDHEESFDLDNLIAALENCDRVRQVDIAHPPDPLAWEQIVTAMQQPFPALRSLWFGTFYHVYLPDTFLNGSAPCLQHLDLGTSSFPSLPQFLSSTSNLTSLRLDDIPDSGYIPPETMATSLSALPKLKTLVIYFKSMPLLQRRNQASLPPTPFVLPVLTMVKFRGVSEYFEVLAARMDAPLLDSFYLTFFHQLVFYIPHTIRFFGHPKWSRPTRLTLMFNLLSDAASIHFPSTGRWEIRCKRLDQQVISVVQICSQILPFLSRVKSLDIRCHGLDPHPVSLRWIQQLENEIDPTLWTLLFHSFTSVQSLDIPATLEPSIAPALQGRTRESAAEVFPLLNSLSIIGNHPDEAAQEGIQSFIAARQHSGRVVAISRHT
jgi:hypothetical protein